MTLPLLEPIYWNWMVFGLVLLAIEVLVPGFFFLWMGIAALLVGILLTIFQEMGWATQVLLFAVLSIVSIVSWQLRLRTHPTPTANPLLNRRGSQYVGRVFTMDTPVVNGYGKIRVDDSTWKVQVNTDCPAGTRVKITRVDGVLLIGTIDHA